MIQVSNEFKKAIKEPERRIKGYVEVLYDLPNVSITPTTNMTSTYTPTSEISNGIRVENLYGSVDYLPLDGSYITMDTTNTNIGFISDELFEDLTSPTITLSFSSTTVKGITMYFRNNTPTDLTINYSDGTSDTITNNERDIVQVIFDEEKTLTSVEAIINDVMYSDRKIYCMEIDLGVTQVYKDQDLIEFTVDEEVNKLVEEVPINETNITLNNMTNLFNPSNPKGIVPYLSENTLIKPYIGVLTENLGVEYVKMGEFYFDNYTNNSDATTMLVGKNYVKQLEKETLKNENETNIFVEFIPKNVFETFMQNYDFAKDLSGFDDNRFYFGFINSNKLIDLLKDTAFYSMALLYFDRNNKLNFKKSNFEIQDNISKTELINDVETKLITKIDAVSQEQPDVLTVEAVQPETVFEKKYTLSKEKEYIVITSNSLDFRGNIVLEQSGATSASIVCHGYSLIFVKIIGTIRSTVTITIKKVYNVTETEGGKKTFIMYPKNELVYKSRVFLPYFEADGFLEYAPSYEMRFDYNGDPSLEAGDYINVETPYGYKSLFIQKNRFKFDGGLEGSIEGVE